MIIFTRTGPEGFVFHLLSRESYRKQSFILLCCQVATWEDWWAMREKLLEPLRAQAEVIGQWWDFTGRQHPGNEEITRSLQRLVSGVLTHPMTIGKVRTTIKYH